jgi:hypothetical protein
VDSLTLDYNNAPSGQVIHGFGLINSNGAVLDTGSHIDTVAHELAHNLGLSDISTDPDNLLQGTNRNIPASVTDPAIAKSIDLLSGSAANDQIAVANKPLFDVGLSTAKISDGGNCPPGVATLSCTFSFVSNGPDAANQLIGLKIRFNNGAADVELPTGLDLAGLTSAAAAAFGCGVSGVHFPLDTNGNITGEEIDYSFAPGCIQAGVADTLQLEPFEGAYQSPFSVEFDFPGGVSSIGAFDATTGTAQSSTMTDVSGIDTSDIPGDGAYIVTDDVPAPVPEPPSLALLGCATALLLIVRGLVRRHPSQKATPV